MKYRIRIVNEGNITEVQGERGMPEDPFLVFEVIYAGLEVVMHRVIDSGIQDKEHFAHILRKRADEIEEWDPSKEIMQ